MKAILLKITSYSSIQAVLKDEPTVQRALYFEKSEVLFYLKGDRLVTETVSFDALINRRYTPIQIIGEEEIPDDLVNRISQFAEIQRGLQGAVTNFWFNHGWANSVS